MPLSLVTSVANTHDVKLLAETLDAIVIDLPSTKKVKNNIFAWMLVMSLNRQNKLGVIWDY